MRVLLVARDAGLARRIARLLEAEGAVLETAPSLPARPRSVDLVLLDLALFRAGGAAAAGKVGAGVFVGLAAEEDLYGPALSAALSAGAADVVPLGLEDRALARRLLSAGRPAAAILADANLRLDLERRTLRLRHGRGWRPASELPRYEFELLRIFLENSGTALPRAALLERLWPGKASEGVNPEALDRHIQRLRRRLGAAGRRLRAVRGVGYILERT